MTSPERAKVLARVADHLVARQVAHPLRVAVDGITAAGKSTFAAELTAAIAARGRTGLHLSTDDFHHQRAHRYRQGRESAVGYYEDAYDLAAFRRLVLEPLGSGTSFRRRHHDLVTDEILDEAPEQAPSDAVVVVDGSYLQGTGVRDDWDEVIFLDTDVSAARARGIARDAEQFGGAAEATRAYELRYHAAAALYLDEVDPASRASILIAHDEPDMPVLRRIGGTAEATVRLFSYGTLQQRDVQRAQFGRQLRGVADVLPGHRTEWVHITDRAVVAASGSDEHPIVRATGSVSDTVAGTVYALSTTELAAADTYEVADYRRVEVRLASGITAWVYLSGG